MDVAEVEADEGVRGEMLGGEEAALACCGVVVVGDGKDLEEWSGCLDGGGGDLGPCRVSGASASESCALVCCYGGGVGVVCQVGDVFWPITRNLLLRMSARPVRRKGATALRGRRHHEC